MYRIAHKKQLRVEMKTVRHVQILQTYHSNVVYEVPITKQIYEEIVFSLPVEIQTF